MTNHQVLDNITHQDIKIITQQHPDFGDNNSYSGLVLSELIAAQAEYPIFLRKSEQGKQAELVALLGLDAQENLFLSEGGWDAHYLPLSIKRRPFLIGFQNQDGIESPVVHIDMDNPRVNTDKGESVFMPHGGQSGYLQEVSAILKALHEGHAQTQAFIQALEEFKLIEPVDLKIELHNQQTIEIQSLLTVNEERLATLDGEQLHSLHTKGYLKHIYMILASLSNLTRLIERKNTLLL